jgi:hypothetical protein
MGHHNDHLLKILTNQEASAVAANILCDMDISVNIYTFAGTSVNFAAYDKR